MSGDELRRWRADRCAPVAWSADPLDLSGEGGDVVADALRTPEIRAEWLGPEPTTPFGVQDVDAGGTKGLKRLALSIRALARPRASTRRSWPSGSGRRGPRRRRSPGGTRRRHGAGSPDARDRDGLDEAGLPNGASSRRPRCTGGSSATRTSSPAHRRRDGRRCGLLAAHDFRQVAGVGRPMHVGLSLIFQGSATRTDHEVYADELKLARLAEPLGFDSVWTVEHHFTSYTMVPDPLQFLTYMAGCTERVQLGTMVVVLPWHDPVRVAEGVAMLDNLSGGRVILGMAAASARRVRWVRRLDGRVTRSVRRDRAHRARRAREGPRAARGNLLPAGTVDLRPAPFKSFGSHVRVGGEPGVSADHGRSARRHHDRAAEAVGAGRRGARGVPNLYREASGTEPPPPASAGWFLRPRPGPGPRAR